MNNLTISPNGEKTKTNELSIHSPNGENNLKCEIVPSYTQLEYYQMKAVGIDLRLMDEMSKAEWNIYCAEKLGMSVRQLERIGYIGRKGLECWIEIIAGKEEHKGGRFSYSMVCELVSYWNYKDQQQLINMWREDKIDLKKFLEVTKALKNGVPYIPEVPKRTFSREVKTKFGTFSLKLETPELNKMTIEEVLPVLMTAMDELHEDLYGENWKEIYSEDFLREI